MKVLLGVTGSVAAVLTPKIVKSLLALDFTVTVVATESSLYFWQPTAVDVPVYLEEDEWPGLQYEKDSSIGHIELREWADLMLIAPITANTLAKMANGFCDNLLTSIVRAWDRQKPIIIAPAMNTVMWTHPATEQHIRQLQQWYDLSVIQPQSKILACGDEGPGALADIKDIVSAVKTKQLIGGGNGTG
ncbi:flavoprotein [Patescibacteria group bacterium]